MRPTVFLAACVLIAGCTPVVSQRGYLQDLDTEASIDPATDTKTTIQQRLGYPSTEAEAPPNGPPVPQALHAR